MIKLIEYLERILPEFLIDIIYKIFHKILLKDISYETFHKTLLAEHEKIASGQPTTEGGAFSRNFIQEKNALGKNILIVDRLKIKLTEENNNGGEADDEKIVELLLPYDEGEYNEREYPSLRDTPIHFRGCIFLNPNGNTGSKFNLMLYKHEAHQISFEKCHFMGTSLEVMQRTDGNMREKFIDPILPRFCIKDSTFTNGAYISIDAEFTHNDFHSRDAGTGNVHIENCTGIAFMSVNATNLTMKGKNRVRRFDYTTPERKFVRNYGMGKPNEQNLSEIPGIYSVYWGPYQEILPDVDNISKYKEFMVKMKKRAKKRSDAWQVEVFNREIIKCDHCIIRTEKISHSFQDWVTLWINQHISNYGISWVRPFALLLAANCMWAVLVPTCDDTDFEYIFFETMNPLTRIDELCTNNPCEANPCEANPCEANPCEANPREANPREANPREANPREANPREANPREAERPWVLLSLLDVLHKLVYALCLYEIVRAGRRFTRLSY